MIKEELLKMELHEMANINKWINVMRVFGGWIYSFNCPPDEGTDYGVFVPEELNVEAHVSDITDRTYQS